MGDSKLEVDIFSFTDYRQYLAEYYRVQKAKHPYFSYRYFARKANISAIGFYRDVLSGRLNLGRSMIRKFSLAMGHTPRQAEYFENMVLFNEAKTIEEKNVYFERMVAVYQSKAFRINSSQYKLFSKWYFLAIREALSFVRTKGDPSDLCKVLDPSVRPENVTSALKLLERIGLICKDAEGYYERINPVWVTDDEVRDLTIANFQVQMMDLAKDSLNRHKSEKRDMSTLTMSVDKDTFAAMKKEIQDFRRKLLAMAENTKNPDRVYHLNCHFFPLTKTEA